MGRVFAVLGTALLIGLAAAAGHAYARRHPAPIARPAKTPQSGAVKQAPGDTVAVPGGTLAADQAVLVNGGLIGVYITACGISGSVNFAPDQFTIASESGHFTPVETGRADALIGRTIEPHRCAQGWVLFSIPTPERLPPMSLTYNGSQTVTWSVPTPIL
jgi:hypothetical protein